MKRFVALQKIWASVLSFHQICCSNPCSAFPTSASPEKLFHSDENLFYGQKGENRVPDRELSRGQTGTTDTLTVESQTSAAAAGAAAPISISEFRRAFSVVARPFPPPPHPLPRSSPHHFGPVLSLVHSFFLQHRITGPSSFVCISTLHGFPSARYEEFSFKRRCKPAERVHCAFEGRRDNACARVGKQLPLQRIGATNTIPEARGTFNACRLCIYRRSLWSQLF